MAEILPVINVATFEEVKKRLSIVEPYATLVHIDVADGSFTETVSWHTPADLAMFKTPTRFEIHFMVREPENKIDPWFLPLISRVIFHYEATEVHDRMIRMCRGAGKGVGIAIRPETSWETLIPFMRSVDLLQMLAVAPGPSGQEFDRRILDKLRALRALDTAIPLEVDGGIKIGIAHECAAAGATILVADSGLFNHGMQFPQALEALRNDARA